MTEAVLANVASVLALAVIYGIFNSAVHTVTFWRLVWPVLKVLGLTQWRYSRRRWPDLEKFIAAGARKWGGR